MIPLKGYLPGEEEVVEPVLDLIRLDLIITNEDNVIENLIVVDPLGKSDNVVME